MNKLSTCLWFDGRIEEAAAFYLALLPGAKLVSKSLVSGTVEKHAKTKKDTALTVVFEYGGTQVMLLNGGPAFKQTEAVSLRVLCETQAEVDRLWSALTADGGRASQCGWLFDKFGVSWQIVPEPLDTMLVNATPEQRERLHAAILTMIKLDLAALERAYRGA